MNIDGSVAFVTGANRGLGAAFTEALLERGAAKVYARVRRPETITDPRLVPIRLELTDPDSIVEAARLAPDVTLVINNAGISTRTPILGDEEGLRQELEVNYLGPVAVARSFAPVLDANGGGAVVNVLSVLSWLSLPPDRRLQRRQIRHVGRHQRPSPKPRPTTHASPGPARGLHGHRHGRGCDRPQDRPPGCRRSHPRRPRSRATRSTRRRSLPPRPGPAVWTAHRHVPLAGSPGRRLSQTRGLGEG